MSCAETTFSTGKAALSFLGHEKAISIVGRNSFFFCGWGEIFPPPPQVGASSETHRRTSRPTDRRQRHAPHTPNPLRSARHERAETPLANSEPSPPQKKHVKSSMKTIARSGALRATAGKNVGVAASSRATIAVLLVRRSFRWSVGGLPLPSQMPHWAAPPR